MSESTILIIEKDAVLYVSLNRPHVHNAFNPEMIADLTDIFSNVGEKTRALVLRGEGSSFSAGADLHWMKSMVNYSMEENIEDSKKLFEMFEAGLSCPCPVIGKLHGHVMGGALGLVAICDVVVSDLTTQFCFSEVKLGLAPAVISPFVFRKMDRAMVFEWMLTGKPFDSKEAQKAGLVQYVGTEQEPEIEKILDRLFQSGTEAVRATKKLIHSNCSKDSWSQIKNEVIRVIVERRVSEEGQEGLKAFLEKRKARWRVDRRNFKKAFLS